MMAGQQSGSFLLYTQDKHFQAALFRTFRLWQQVVCLQAELRCTDQLEDLQALGERDILFLDIDGLCIPPSRLRLPALGALVLCAQNPSQSIACYALHPVDFLSKPVCLSVLERALERCIPLWQDRLQWLELSAGRVQIPLCELIWAEASGHSSVLHCLHSVIRASESLSKLADQLPQTLFFRCQRSFLVNLRHIQSLEAGCFQMAGGGQVPIGRGSREQALQLYQRFRRLLKEPTTPPTQENCNGAFNRDL